SLDASERGAAGMTRLFEEKRDSPLVRHQAPGRGEFEKRPIALAVVTTFARLAQDTAHPNWGSEDELAIALEDWAWAEAFANRTATTHPALPSPIPSPCG